MNIRRHGVPVMIFPAIVRIGLIIEAIAAVRAVQFYRAVN